MYVEISKTIAVEAKRSPNNSIFMTADAIGVTVSHDPEPLMVKEAICLEWNELDDFIEALKALKQFRASLDAEQEPDA